MRKRPALPPDQPQPVPPKLGRSEEISAETKAEEDMEAIFRRYEKDFKDALSKVTLPA